MGFDFYQDPDANYGIQVALGGVWAGLGDVGEILVAVQEAPDGDDESSAAAFGSLAERVEGIAETSRASGDQRSARDAYLRAATYYAAKLESVQSQADDSVPQQAFTDHRRCWNAFADLNDPPLERVDIPYEGGTLPGYFLGVDGSKRPTLVLINGSDGALTWVWQEMLAAHRRGFNALIFDGPGQQSMLFERGVPFRPDWEAVITPVVDFLSQRSDVDTDAMVLWGGSQGGFWGARALAFEKRFAAAFLDPGVVDVSTSWLSHFPPELLQMLDSGDKEDFNAAMAGVLQTPGLSGTWHFRARPYQQPTPFDVCSVMRAYTVADVAHQITTPVMIADPEGEQFWPGQPAQLADLVGDVAVLQRFTAAEGADMHCEPMARSLVHQRMYDWLSTVLPKSH